MATTLEELQVKISANIQGYTQALNTAVNKTRVTTSQINSSVSKMNSAFSSMAATVGAAFSITALVSFGKACINVASDLSEVQNVVDVTFGTGNKQIEEFAKSAAKNFGLSELAAKQYASTTGAMLKSMGLGSSEVEEMSTAIAGLTGDMASFYNLDSQTAFNKLRSGLSGETEPLKQLGINMSKANLEQYRMSQGIKTAYDKMSEAEKVMLRYNYILSVTSDAQGDFSRTSNSWANQTRILALNFEQLKATLGQGLINALTPAIQLLNTLIEKLQVVANAFRDLSIILFGDAGAGGESTSEVLDDVSSSFNSTSKNANKTSKAVSSASKSLATFDRLNMLSKSSGVGSGSLSSIKSSGSGSKTNINGASLAGDTTTSIAQLANEVFKSDWNFAPSLKTILNQNIKSAFRDAKNGNWQSARRTLVDTIDIAVPFTQLEASIMGGPVLALRTVRNLLDNDALKVGTALAETGMKKLNEYSGTFSSTAKALTNTILPGSTEQLSKLYNVAYNLASLSFNPLTSSLAQLGNTANEQTPKFSTLFGAVSSSASTSANGIKSTFAKTFDDIESDAKKTTKATLNDLINKTEKALKNMIPSINKFFGTYNTRPESGSYTPIKTSAINMPTLGTGGITTGSTIANIGEAGTEAVIPLSKDRLAKYGLGTSDEEIALLREQNMLLSAILEKGTTISSSQVFNAVQSESRDVFVRTGKNALVF